jgi:hypothetical protein
MKWLASQYDSGCPRSERIEMACQREPSKWQVREAVWWGDQRSMASSSTRRAKDGGAQGNWHLLLALQHVSLG